MLDFEVRRYKLLALFPDQAKLDNAWQGNIGMTRISAAVAAAALIILSTSADARDYIFKANGFTTSAYSADQNFNQIENPPSSIEIGDNFSVSFRISPKGAAPVEFFDADPAINIYWYYVTDFNMKVGANFITSPIIGEETFASFQLWNDYRVSGVANPVDNFSLSILRYLPPGSSPVDLGNGLVNAQFHYEAF